MKGEVKSEEICYRSGRDLNQKFTAIIQFYVRKVRRHYLIGMIAAALALLASVNASAATYLVINTNNSGAGSLRQAILDANTNPGPDLINFNIPGAGGHIIFLKTLLPVITDPVTIDGYSQPGATSNTATMADNATLLIELTGTDPLFFNAGDGLVITAGDSTVKGMIINGFNNENFGHAAIKLTGKGGNLITGNFLGTNSNGFSSVPNGVGILIDGSGSNVIGGNLPDARNVISGNGRGVVIQNAGAFGNAVAGNFVGTNRNGNGIVGNTSVGIEVRDLGTADSHNVIGGTAPGLGNLISGNDTGIETVGDVNDLRIQGNLIGTDVSGKGALGNYAGIITSQSSGSPSLTVVGGAGAAGRNVISGNQNFGLLLGQDSGVVQGNYIGTDITGNVALGNISHGLIIESSHNTIGGAVAGEGNVISGNGNNGVYLIGNNTPVLNFIIGNLIGYGADGSTPMGNKGSGVSVGPGNGPNNIIGGPGAAGNRIAFNQNFGVEVTGGKGYLISGNSITANGALGIDLYPSGINLNDQGDTDTGANELQNFPVLISASLISNGLTYINGGLNSTPNTKFTVELFENDAPDPSGFGEGQKYLGAVDVTTDASGNGSFIASFAALSVGHCIAATAIDPGLNTSEFSKCITISPNAPGALQFNSSTYSVKENGTQATISVKRSGGNFGTVTVQYATASGGTAVAGSDYTAVSGTLTWGDGDASDKTFTIPILNDSIVEPDETLNITLTNPTNGATLGGPTSAVLTIVDDDSPPKVSIDDVSKAEGNNGTTNFTFTVTLSGASSQTVSVNYTTADNTALAGSDYQAANDIVTFAPGETSKQITVLVNGDTQVEPNETFAVNLYNLNNASVGKVTGVGTIVNDDSNSPSPTIQFSQATYSVQEDLSAINITVTRSGDTSGAASVDYTTTDGSAAQKTDFEYAAGSLTFAPGETSKTITVLVNEDMYNENSETFGVTLKNPSGAAIGAQGVAMITITDDLPESISNPIDDAQSFVYMHYHDFLNREPDAAGLAFWTNQITACGTDAKCIDAARVNVSASFFLSIEFQQTAYLLYLMQKESYATLPQYASFMRDLQEISRGVIVNSPGWQKKLADNQQQFADKWINRPEFKTAYDGLSNDAYVNALYKNAGLVPPQAEKDKLVVALNTAGMDRSAALLEVAGDTTFRQQERNGAFVLAEYFGYLRRDPNAAPDSDLSGYNFWLNKLNLFGGAYVDAEMVKAFIVSNEYRQRFGQ